jgi:hypothetical protein
MLPELVPYGKTIPEVIAYSGTAEAWQLLSNIAAILMYKEEASGLQSLLDYERHIYAIHGMLQEVNNGGFDQFFSNSSGLLAYDLVPALKLIGSKEFLPIAEDALKRFGSPSSLSEDDRWHHLVAITNDREVQLWEDCDGKFYKCSEQIETLAIQYLKTCISANVT